MDRLAMLTLLALRTMVSHRVKNAIVGSIMIFGTLLVVVGTSLLDSIQDAMERSITASVTGHIQVFDARAKDTLAIFGQMGSNDDFGEIEDFQSLQKKLLEFPEVEAVVPMALGNAVSFGKGELDRVLFDMREALRADDPTTLTQKKAHVQQIARLMLEENTGAAEISTDLDQVAEERAIIERVLSDGFWEGYPENASDTMEYLDTKLAPLSTEGRLIYVRYVATDPDHFKDSFERFQIVDGEMIPTGHRGILLSKRYYEKQIKNRVARELDAIYEDVQKGGKIAEDEVLKNRIDRLSKIGSSIAFQLDAEGVKIAEEKLRAILPNQSGGIDTLMADFLTVTDENIGSRYEFFYREIAPMVEIYDVSVGDEIVLQAFTKSGYAKSVKVKIWGTFNFQGLETSDLAGSTNIMDLVTFRALYGKMTAEQVEELADIKEELGLEVLTAENAEDALFGGGEIEARAAPDTESPIDIQIERDSDSLQLATYRPEELNAGVVLNAAIILKDPASVGEVIARIGDMESELGIKAIDWQEASGIVGQFIFVIRLVLFTAIFIIFLVALVIINNSMVMATMERIPEIGTMRAIGAQKSTIMLMTLLETTVLCVLAGSIGAGLGAGLIFWLGHVGIPAPNDVMVFIFGGPELYPTVGLEHLAFGAGIILLVSLVSTLYPAIVATRVHPVVAMRGKD